MPQTETADKNETDIRADASTSFLLNIKPIATVGQTSKHLQLDLKQLRSCILLRSKLSSLITREHGYL